MSLFPIVAVDESTAEEVVLPAFIVARDGLYLRKHSLLGTSQVHVDGARHLPEASEYLEYELPKLPAELMGQVVGFFAAIWRTWHSEAMVLLTWDGSAFGLIVPEQQADWGSVQHRLKPADVPAGVQLLGTIHSHADMTAFHSGTDEIDEVDVDGLHIVVGEVDRDRPSFSAAVVIDGRRFSAAPSMVFEPPGPKFDPPAEWLDRVKPLRWQARSAKVKSKAPKPRPAGDNDESEDSSLGWADELALDDLLGEATQRAARLGYVLEYRLEPIADVAMAGAAS
jgi:hypothetical protein